MNYKRKKPIARYIGLFSIFLFIGCIGFLIYYLGIQPYYSRQVTNKYRAIYHENEPESTVISTSKKEKETISLELDDSYDQSEKDSDGILLKFSKLLSYNSDVKGWLSIDSTGIDYPVMQSFDGGDFYLRHDFEGNKDKNGSLYIDGNCNVKKPSKNIVIHGHNMESTRMMFFELLSYNNLDYYKEHPVIHFDSIYRNGKYKIISFMRVPGKYNPDSHFNYLQSNFQSDDEFLDFLYQIRSRSLYYCPVDVNENDSLLMLSTCSYEAYNYRTVIVARKIRKKESKKVDVEQAYIRENTLYPSNWYSKYGGEKPLVTNFANAYSFNEIDWYDGNYSYPPAIGTTFTSDDCTYKITDYDTVKLISCQRSNIKTLNIPSDVTDEYKRKFSVTTIDKHAFDKCKKVKEIKIGNKIQEIPSKTFIKCKKLERVYIGKNVESIGKKAFYELNNLSYIKLRGANLKTIDEKAFKKISEKAKFKLPSGKYKKYKKLIEKASCPEKSKFKTFE